MNFYALHIGDYLSATTHLSWLEDLAYRRLLDTYYSREAPLPLDLAATARLVRATRQTQQAAVQAVLEEFFTRTPAGWTHQRCEEEISKASVRRDRATDLAQKRWARPAAEPAAPTGPAPAAPTGSAPAPVQAECNASRGTHATPPRSPADVPGNVRGSAVDDAPSNAADDAPSNAAGDGPSNAAGDASRNAAGDGPRNAAGDAPRNAAGDAHAMRTQPAPQCQGNAPNPNPIPCPIPIPNPGEKPALARPPDFVEHQLATARHGAVTQAADAPHRQAQIEQPDADPPDSVAAWIRFFEQLQFDPVVLRSAKLAPLFAGWVRQRVSLRVIRLAMQQGYASLGKRPGSPIFYAGFVAQLLRDPAPGTPAAQSPPASAARPPDAPPATPRPAIEAI